MASSINTSNQASQIGITPFMLAAGSNDASVDTLRHMVDSGAIPNEVFDLGGTALIHACSIPPNENQVAKARYIIEATATSRNSLNAIRMIALEHIPKELLEIIYNYAWTWGADFVNAEYGTKTRTVTALENAITVRYHWPIDIKCSTMPEDFDQAQLKIAIAEWQEKVKKSAQTATSAAVNTALALRAARTQATAAGLELVPISTLRTALASAFTESHADPENARLNARLMEIIDGSGKAWRIEMIKLLLSSGAKLLQQRSLLSDEKERFSLIQVKREVKQALERAAKEQEAINKAASTKK